MANEARKIANILRDVILEDIESTLVEAVFLSGTDRKSTGREAYDWFELHDRLKGNEKVASDRKFTYDMEDKLEGITE